MSSQALLRPPYETSSVSCVSGQRLADVLQVEVGVDRHAAHGAVDDAVLQRRDHFRQAHRHRGRAKRGHARALGRRRIDAQLQPLEVVELAQWPLDAEVKRLRGDREIDADEALRLRHAHAHIC